MTHYVIVGNGVAGTTAAENVRRFDPDGPITILTDEEMPFYYRLRLNEYLAGDVPEEKLFGKKEGWYQDNRIDLKLGLTVVSGDPEQKVLRTADGQTFSYDVLLLANGSHSFVPPIQGADTQGVFTLRTLQDYRDTLAYARDVQKVVLIGGGLLGLEAGHGLLKQGKDVQVVEFFPRLLPRQLDDEGAKRLRLILEEKGFTFYLGAKTSEIAGQERVESVRLEGGASLEAGLALISAGIRPNLEPAQSMGIEVDRGIKVDSHLRTSCKDVYAAGDVAEFRRMNYGIWPAAMEQGQMAGLNMAGQESLYQGTTMANTLKVLGVELGSAGNIDSDNKLQAVMVAKERIYKKIVIDDQDKIAGCIMLGDTTGFNKVVRFMGEGRKFSDIKEQLQHLALEI
ncbi:MAG: FAD-dependent oxidoreductase [Desulfohalobiaceae bacterium]|nr:FAD-dependent oxidoreductase [Desulfohalobiaceae bacterium]